MRLLFVCTGNVCRSPVAERTARALLDATLGPSAAAIGTASAGTRAVVDAPVHPLSVAALVELGGEPDGFRARQLEPAHIKISDLVLTMTRRHRDDVLRLAPGALRRTFTLAEAATLLRGADPLLLSDHRRASLVDVLNAERARRPGADRDDDDIADPIGRDSAVHRATALRIRADLQPLIEALCDDTVAAAADGIHRPHMPTPRTPASSTATGPTVPHV